MDTQFEGHGSAELLFCICFPDNSIKQLQFLTCFPNDPTVVRGQASVDRCPSPGRTCARPQAVALEMTYSAAEPSHPYVLWVDGAIPPQLMVISIYALPAGESQHQLDLPTLVGTFQKHLLSRLVLSAPRSHPPPSRSACRIFSWTTPTSSCSVPGSGQGVDQTHLV